VLGVESDPVEETAADDPEPVLPPEAGDGAV
jgi:hypothetical protein